MTKLLIVESPAKCQKIQGFLGEGWQVLASMGHIRALEQDLKAIGLENNFEPTYEWIKEKARAIKDLKDAAKQATMVYLAADDDREGEAIAYSVCLLLKKDPAKTPRAVFHEITKAAVLKAVESPRLLDMHRVHAQQARAMLDMMIGFTISPLLWRYIAPALSAGRCQTPALRLVSEREDQIRDFQASSSWKLMTQWTHPKLGFDATMVDELEDEESAVNYMELVHQQPEGVIKGKVVKPWSAAAPPPLITSTLQQQASALYHMNPKSTMQVAQKLYEAGHITYMRTDKAILSEEAEHQAKAWVAENYGENYVGTHVKPVKLAKPAKEEKEAKPQAQEAHEAIRPTHLEVPTIQGDPYEVKLYKLIWQRTIQSVMAPAKGETCTVTTQIKDDPDFHWMSSFTHTLFEGWKRAGKIALLEEKDDEENQEADNWNAVMSLQQGDAIAWIQMKAEPKETRAQGRYTEATLVRELEKHGIGRPSTFASLLSVIQDKNYVEIKTIPAKEVQVTEYTMKPHVWPAEQRTLQKKVGGEVNKLVPTELGRSVLHFLLRNMDDIFAYAFTAQMEQRLDRIAEGEEPWKNVLKDTWDQYKERCATLSDQKKEQPRESAKIRTFSNGLKAVQSKKGPLLVEEGKTKEDTHFFGWPTGVAFTDITEEQALKHVQQTKQQKEGHVLGTWKDYPLIHLTGKFGDYVKWTDGTITLSVPYQDELLEATIVRLEAKQQGASTALKQFKEYVIRQGQYGPYIMKTTLKKPQFVSLPKGVNIATLTEKDTEGLYKIGLEAKKAKATK